MLSSPAYILFTPIFCTRFRSSTSLRLSYRNSLQEIHPGCESQRGVLLLGYRRY